MCFWFHFVHHFSIYISAAVSFAKNDIISVLFAVFINEIGKIQDISFLEELSELYREFLKF